MSRPCFAGTGLALPPHAEQNDAVWRDEAEGGTRDGTRILVVEDDPLIVRTSDDPEPGRREWLRAIGQQFGRGRR
jgi:hypothetical protein